MRVDIRADREIQGRNIHQTKHEDYRHAAPSPPTSLGKDGSMSIYSNKLLGPGVLPLDNMAVHSVVHLHHRKVTPYLKQLLPLYADDDARMQAPATSPNNRKRSPAIEADCELWFHTEISNVIMPAWAVGRPMMTQPSHIKPPHNSRTTQAVDLVYTMKYRGTSIVIAIGELKCLIYLGISLLVSLPSGS